MSTDMKNNTKTKENTIEVIEEASVIPEDRIVIPSEISVVYQDRVLSVKKGDKEVKKTLFFPGVIVLIEGNEVVIKSRNGSRKYKRIVKTYTSHIKNMIEGIERGGWKAELKVVYSHFPMTVKVEGEEVKITNFFGGSKPKKAKIIPGTKVIVNGKDITVEGDNLEDVGQMAANIEKMTKLSGVDRRKFQDGIFITKKPKDN